ncbi:unnamed protein product [Diatraea saccharalis]|uniref:Cyclic nucleotide-binding domain-containing protein n=1 Tax=Diatraea saccharalis TaxID=40085 RepID=A0A9N9N198_9NEOP|nr:unnamed protein product [Diatraea saccharalis]
MTKYRIVEQHNKFFKSFPIAVKREIVINSYIRKVTRIPYFAEWPMRMMENLILLLKEEIYLKNDTVCECGVPGNGMIIVDAGVMAVYTSDGEEKGHLIDGDYFGELSLIIDNERRTSSVLAVTTTKVLVLEKGAFRLFMREYPKLFFEMKQSIRDLYLGTVSSLDSTGVKTQSS